MLCWPLFPTDLEACTPGLPTSVSSRETLQVRLFKSERIWLQNGPGCLCCALQVIAGHKVLLHPGIFGMPAGSSVPQVRTWPGLSPFDPQSRPASVYVCPPSAVCRLLCRMQPIPRPGSCSLLTFLTAFVSCAGSSAPPATTRVPSMRCSLPLLRACRLPTASAKVNALPSKCQRKG